MYQKWTDDEIGFLKSNFASMTISELITNLNHSKISIIDKAYTIGLKKKGAGANWTVEELDYLQESWGDISVPTIAKNLNRSVLSVREKAVRCGLNRHLHQGDYITVNQLFVSFGINSYSWVLNRWIEREFPIKYKRVIKQRYRVIYLEEFWNWAKDHKDIIDFSNLEKGILGSEPSWVADKRKADISVRKKYKSSPWSSLEDAKLRKMLNTYKYGYKEISEAIGRTEGAVKRRICTLRLNERPIKAERQFWTDKETHLLLNMVSKGYSYELISEKIGTKSALACRGKMERLTNCYPGWKEVDSIAEEGS